MLAEPPDPPRLRKVEKPSFQATAWKPLSVSLEGALVSELGSSGLSC